jgi:hypothetical protein
MFSLGVRLPSGVPGHPRNERPCSQTPPECIPGGTGVYDFSGVEKSCRGCRESRTPVRAGRNGLSEVVPGLLGKRNAGELHCLTSGSRT